MCVLLNKEGNLDCRELSLLTYVRSYHASQLHINLHKMNIYTHIDISYIADLIVM